MVGSAIVRKLQSTSPSCEIVAQTRDELDLCNQAATHDFLETEKPDAVIFAAAKVGGIHANNSYPAEFMYDNLAMASNTIHGSYLAGVPRLLFLGSTCVYPRMATQPMAESCLLTGPLESTNEAYALAKIAGLKMCQHYRSQYGVTYHSAMPTNLYGPGDNYHPENSHVLPALIRRFHEAKLSEQPEVVIWGTGTPRREFLHVDDLAAGLIHLLGLDNPPDLVNVGTGTDVSIQKLAELIAEVVGFKGSIKTDPSKPDGTPVKRTDMTLMQQTDWSAKIDLESGLKSTYECFLQESKQGVLRSV
ncbi:UNVERIFIED_CONTAM: hypothetical protein GTU68_018411 [Idotea baltica]|nr:hypothetical protein [Idotea baltica]